MQRSWNSSSMRSVTPNASGSRARGGDVPDGERGAITAEFAVVLPAVLVILVLAIGGVLLAAHRVALVALAGEVARLEARGDADRAAARLRAAGAAPEVERRRTDGLHCITLRERPADGLLASITVSARACAAVSGEGSLP